MFIFMVLLMASIFLWGFRVGKKEKEVIELIVHRPMRSSWQPVPCPVCKQEIPTLLNQIFDHQDNKH